MSLFEVIKKTIRAKQAKMLIQNQHMKYDREFTEEEQKHHDGTDEDFQQLADIMDAIDGKSFNKMSKTELMAHISFRFAVKEGIWVHFDIFEEERG